MSVQKNFLVNISLLVLINLLIKPLYAFGVDIQVQTQLGNVAYGRLFALWNLSYLLAICADMGILQHNSSQVSKDSGYFLRYAGAIFKTKLLLSVSYALICLLLGWLLGYGWENLPLLGLLVINQILIGLIAYGRSNIAGLGRYKTDSLLSALDKTLMLGFGGLLLWSGRLSVLGFVLSQTLAFGLTLLLVAAINLYLYRKLQHESDCPLETADFRPMELLRKCLPYALVVLLMGLYARVDTVLLERLAADPAEAGRYGFAFRLLDLANMVGVLFGGLLLNMFSKNLNQLAALRKLFWLSLLILVGGYLLGLLVCVLAGDWICALLLGSAEPQTVLVLQLLFTALVFGGLVHIAGTLLTAAADLRRMNWLFVGAILLNVGLNLLLIPAYGAVAAASVAIATQALVGLVEMGWAYRHLYPKSS